MPVISGGFTEDAVVVDILDSTGLITTLWRTSIQKLTYFKLCSKESTGTLETSEKNLLLQLIGQSGLSEWAVDRIDMFIKLEAIYWTKGMYMTGAELSTCIDSQWLNILKVYT